MFDTYRNSNNDACDPYHQLETCCRFGLLHDATSYWVPEINTVFLHVVSDDSDFFKVTYSMKKVSGGFSEENLCKELATDISSIKAVLGNTTVRLPNAIKAYTGFVAAKPVQKYKRLHLQLKIAAETANFDELLSTKAKMEDLVKDFHHLSCDLESAVLVDNEETETEFILPKPKFSLIFYIAHLTGIVDDSILSSVDPSNISTTTCRDGCAVNTKGTRLLDEVYSIKAHFSKCSSHLASGTIRHLCTSVILNRNIVHILNWECTKMASFLDACIQSSGIVVPFLDTFLDSISLVNHKIQQDLTKFISGPKGKHLLQLFADLDPAFTNRYLH